MIDDTVTPEARLPEILAAAVRESAERGYATVVVARADLEALLALVPAVASSPEPGLDAAYAMVEFAHHAHGFSDEHCTPANCSVAEWLDKHAPRQEVASHADNR